MRWRRRWISLTAVLATQTATAAVIFSNCPVLPTDTQGPALDRFRPEQARLWVQSYSTEFPRLARYLVWLFNRTDKTQDAQNQAGAAARIAGEWLEDVQFTMVLANGESRCHDTSNPTTRPYAIFPFVMRVQNAAAKPKYRLRFKLCEYYADAKRQIPIEDACSVLGRESGYTFAELENRFKSLRRHVEKTQSVIHGLSYASGLLASFATFRVLRLFRIAGFSGLTLTILPTAGAYLAVQRGWTDDFIRDMVDFKDAAEVPIDGDLSTSVKVSRPIQEFASYFERYLDSIKDGASE